jgi:hypothetical protein
MHGPVEHIDDHDDGANEESRRSGTDVATAANRRGGRRGVIVMERPRAL